MNFQLQPIIITPEQIIAAAQKIANQADDVWQNSEAEWLEAVEHYLRCKVNDILIDADWHANKDHFDVERTCDYPTCYAKPAPHSVYCSQHSDAYAPETASELVLPPAPEWALDRAAALPAAHDRVVITPDGEIWAK
jgi:hypothetical protein